MVGAGKTGEFALKSMPMHGGGPPLLYIKRRARVTCEFVRKRGI